MVQVAESHKSHSLNYLLLNETLAVVYKYVPGTRVYTQEDALHW